MINKNKIQMQESAVYLLIRLLLLRLLLLALELIQ